MPEHEADSMGISLDSAGMADGEAGSMKTPVAPSSSSKRKGSASGPAGNGAAAAAGKAGKDSGNGTKGWCHQCHTQSENIICCTETTGKHMAQCKKKYCSSCFRHYHNHDFDVATASKSWKCFFCLGICSCGKCRKRRGLDPNGEPLGSVKCTATPGSDASQCQRIGNGGSSSSSSSSSSMSESPPDAAGRGMAQKGGGWVNGGPGQPGSTISPAGSANSKPSPTNGERIIWNGIEGLSPDIMAVGPQPVVAEVQNALTYVHRARATLGQSMTNGAGQSGLMMDSLIDDSLHASTLSLITVLKLLSTQPPDLNDFGASASVSPAFDKRQLPYGDDLNDSTGSAGSKHAMSASHDMNSAKRHCVVPASAGLQTDTAGLGAMSAPMMMPGGVMPVSSMAPPHLVSTPSPHAMQPMSAAGASIHGPVMTTMAPIPPSNLSIAAGGPPGAPMTETGKPS